MKCCLSLAHRYFSFAGTRRRPLALVALNQWPGKCLELDVLPYPSWGPAAREDGWSYRRAPSSRWDKQSRLPVRPALPPGLLHKACKARWGCPAMLPSIPALGGNQGVMLTSDAAHLAACLPLASAALAAATPGEA